MELDFTSENRGLIHEKLDLKILILFVLRRLKYDAEPETLFELCSVDEGVQYFDYMECLHELIITGNVEETIYGYKITEKGSRNAEAVDSSLPYSVRAKTLEQLEPEQERLARAAMITSERVVEAGSCMVHLALSDGVGEVIRLSMLCADEEQAIRSQRNFRRNAETIYEKIAEILSEDPRMKK